MRTLLIIGLALSLNGCVMMSHKEFLRQQNLWQSVGQMSATIDYQNSMIANLLNRQFEVVKDTTTKEKSK